VTAFEGQVVNSAGCCWISVIACWLTATTIVSKVASVAVLGGANYGRRESSR